MGLAMNPSPNTALKARQFLAIGLLAGCIVVVLLFRTVDCPSHLGLIAGNFGVFMQKQVQGLAELAILTACTVYCVQHFWQRIAWPLKLPLNDVTAMIAATSLVAVVWVEQVQTAKELERLAQEASRANLCIYYIGPILGGGRWYVQTALLLALFSTFFAATKSVIWLVGVIWRKTRTTTSQE
jgi:hypothetical protein